MTDYEREKIRWEAEVDCVAAQLIREGVAPFAAMSQATQVVAERRKREMTERVKSVYEQLGLSGNMIVLPKE